MFRNLANYLSSTDKSIKYVTHLYKISIPTPVPDLPPDITTLFPNEDTKILTKKKQKPENVVSSLGYDFDSRFTLVSAILALFSSKKLEISQSQYLAFITLRSCCGLLFWDLEDIDPNYVLVFIRCLKTAVNYLPEDNSYIGDFISIFFELISKINDPIKFINALPTIIEFFDQYPNVCAFCLQTNLVVVQRSTYILLNEVSTPMMHVIVAKYFNSISHSFCYCQNLDPTKITQPVIGLLELKTSNELKLSILTLFLSLNRTTNEVIPILRIITANLIDNIGIPRKNFIKNRLTTMPLMAYYDTLPENHDFFVNQESIKIHGLLEISTVIFHPAIKAASILSDHFLKVGPKSFIEFSSVLIKSEDTNLMALLILTILCLGPYQKEIGYYYAEQNSWSLFFNEIIFNPSVTYFSNRTSSLVALRQSLFDVLSFLSVDPLIVMSIRYCFAEFLKSIVTYSHLVSEVLLMSYPRLKQLYNLPVHNDKLFDTVLEIAVYQQQETIRVKQEAQDYRILTLSVIREMLQNEEPLKAIASSKYACLSLISFMFEPQLITYFTPVYVRLLKIVTKYYKTIDTFNLADAFHQAIQLLVHDMMSLELLQAIMKMIEESPNIAIYQSVLISDILQIITNLPNEDSKTILQSCLHTLIKVNQRGKFNYKLIPFAAIADKCVKIGVDDTIFSLLLEFVCSSSLIIFPEALHLLINAVKDTERYDIVLTTLIQLCETSICNRCSCIVSNIPSLVFELSNETNFNNSLKLFCLITKTISNRRALFSFYNQFLDFSDEIVNPKLFKCLDVLYSIIKESDDLRSCSLLQFCSNSHYLELPTIMFNDIRDGILIDCKLLLDSEQPGRQFFDMFSQSISYSVAFAGKSIFFETLNGNQTLSKTFDIDHPIRQWFHFSVMIKPFDSISFFVDGILKAGLALPFFEVEGESFKTTMFSSDFYNNGTLALQVMKIDIYTGFSGFEMSAFVDSNINELYSQAQCLFKFNANRVQQNELINNNGPNATFSALSIPFYSTFMRIFEASHAIDFVLALFAQLDFLNSHGLLIKLLDIITEIIQSSPECGEQMLSQQGYSIIEYFLTEVDPSYLTADVWQTFLFQMSYIRNDELRKSLAGEIFFNFKIWQRAKLDVQAHVITDWKAAQVNWPQTSNQFLHLPFLLSVYEQFIDTPQNLMRFEEIEDLPISSSYDTIEPVTMPPQLGTEIMPRSHSQPLALNYTEFVKSKLIKMRALFSMLFVEAISISFTCSDAQFLFQSIAQCQNPDQAIELLNLVECAMDMQRKSIQSYDLKDDWAPLFMHKDEFVLIKWMSIFALLYPQPPVHIVKYVQLLLLFQFQRKLREEDNSDLSALINCCRIMLGIKGPIQLSKLLNESLMITNIVYFQFAIVLVNFVPEPISNLFASLIMNFTNTPTNTVLIAESLNKVTLFYFLYWSLTRNRDLITSIALIISHRSTLIDEAIGILDSISSLTDVDVSEYRSNLLDIILTKVMNQPHNEQLITSAKAIANAILFHHKIYKGKTLYNAFENSIFTEHFQENVNEKNQPFPDLMAIAFLYSSDSSNDPVSVFSLRFDQEGEWVDQDIAKRLIFIMSSLKIEFLRPYLMILLFYYCEVCDISTCAAIFPLITEVVKQNDDYTLLLMRALSKFHKIPIDLKVSNKQRRKTFSKKSTTRKSTDTFIPDLYADEENDNAFMKSNSVALVSGLLKNEEEEDNNDDTKPGHIQIKTSHSTEVLTMFPELQIMGDGLPDFTPLLSNVKKGRLADMGFNILNIFCDNPPTVIADAHNELAHDFSNIVEITAHQKRKDHCLIKQSSGSHHWRRLWQQISISLDLTKDIHFKRGAIVDSSSRPILLKRNLDFDIHSGDIFPRPRHFDFGHEPRFFDQRDPKNVCYFSPANFMRIEKTTTGILYVETDRISYISTAGKRTHILTKTIERVIQQVVLQRLTALEIFTYDHNSYLFNFPTTSAMKGVLSNIFLPNATFVQTHSSKVEIERFTQLWVDRKISNFEYLTWLNALGGRTFNSPWAYPVFPWIINDYQNKDIDFNNESNFRDLSKPVGALNEARLQKIKALQSEVESEQFLYRSTYSCTFHVFHYLVRLEPFTSLHIAMQDGKFDVAPRLFSSIQNSYDRVVGSSLNFRELIPEFFYQPEFLTNTDNFKFGGGVNDVELPSWAQTPEEFIYKHRVALESNYVSSHLNQWIDLIFGYKQTGPDAVAADNVFDPHLYSNVWQKYPDENDREQIEALLAHVGQIPQQLFDEPHPSRSQYTPPQPSPVSIVLITNSPIVAINIINDKPYTLHSDGRVFCQKNNIFKPNCPKITAPSSVDCGFVYSFENSNDIMKVKNSMITEKRKLHIDAITCSCGYRDSVITGGKDSIIANESTSLMIHVDVINCICANEKYGVVISCSNDGMMVISRIHKLTFIRSINLQLPAGYVPQHVEVTNGFGYIVVVASDLCETSQISLISVFTLNGKKIREIRLSYLITAMKVASNKALLDFVVVGSDSNRVIVFNAFLLEQVGVAIETQSKIRSLYYYPNTETIYAGTETGILHSTHLCI